MVVLWYVVSLSQKKSLKSLQTCALPFVSSVLFSSHGLNFWCLEFASSKKLSVVEKWWEFEGIKITLNLLLFLETILRSASFNWWWCVCVCYSIEILSFLLDSVLILWMLESLDEIKKRRKVQTADLCKVMLRFCILGWIWVNFVICRNVLLVQPGPKVTM